MWHSIQWHINLQKQTNLWMLKRLSLNLRFFFPPSSSDRWTCSLFPPRLVCFVLVSSDSWLTHLMETCFTVFCLISFQFKLAFFLWLEAFTNLLWAINMCLKMLQFLSFSAWCVQRQVINNVQPILLLQIYVAWVTATTMGNNWRVKLLLVIGK